MFHIVKIKIENSKAIDDHIKTLINVASKNDLSLYERQVIWDTISIMNGIKEEVNP